MKFPHLPPNPFSDSPERISDVVRRKRLAVFGSSLLVLSGAGSHELMDTTSNWQLATVIGCGIGFVALASAVIPEVQERYGDWDDDDEGGGDWPPDDGPDEPPDEPPGPTFGLEADWIHEVEDFLRESHPACVA